VREYTGPKSEIVHVAFVPSTPPRLAAVDRANVYLWNLDYPKPVAELRWDGKARGNPVLAVSPDGRWIVAGPIERLLACDTTTLRSKPSSLFGAAGSLRVDFDRDSDRLRWICRMTGGILMRIDVPVRRGRGRLKSSHSVYFVLTDDLADRVAEINPADGPRHTALSPGGARFAFSGWHEKGVTVWDGGTGFELGRIPLRGTTECLALSPDGSRLAIDGGTTVYVHDATSLDLVVKGKVNYSYVPQLAWAPDGRLLGRADRSTTARLYDAATGREVSALGTKRGRAAAIAFAPDGLTYATGHSDGTVRVWDVG
jgi:WD40 repeat protein